MNILNIHLTSDDKQIIAAAVGAILGAMGAYIVGLLVEKRIKRNETQKQELAELREYEQCITKAEVCCREVLVVLYDVDHLLGQCADMIKDGGWILTLPRRVSINDVSALDFRNEQLSKEWITLRFRIDKLNHLIKEFNDHYMATTRTYDQMALRGESAVVQVVNDNDEVMKSFALKVQESTKSVIGTAKHVYALVLAHAQLKGHEEASIKSIEQLSTFRVSQEHYRKVRTGLDKRFSRQALYGTPGASAPTPKPSPAAASASSVPTVAPTKAPTPSSEPTRATTPSTATS